jgi:hypothetical protein
MKRLLEVSAALNELSGMMGATASQNINGQFVKMFSAS